MQYVQYTSSAWHFCQPRPPCPSLACPWSPPASCLAAFTARKTGRCLSLSCNAMQCTRVMDEDPTTSMPMRIAVRSRTGWGLGIGRRRLVVVAVVCFCFF